MLKFPTLFVFFVLCTSYITGATMGDPIPETKKVSLSFSDLEASGNLMIGVYSANTDFLGDSRFAEYVLPVTSKRKKIELSLPSGTYALAVFQDLNGNGKLDKNIFGYPKEPYGFSSKSYTGFLPPSFAQASFQVEEDVSLHISLK